MVATRKPMLVNWNNSFVLMIPKHFPFFADFALAIQLRRVKYTAMFIPFLSFRVIN